MKKPTTRIRKSKECRRLTVVAITTVILLGIGAATAISRQKAEPDKPQKPQFANNADKKYVTVKVGGQDVQVDGQTGKIKPLTPQEVERMAKGLKEMLNQSTEGLVQVRHPDGSVSMDLQDRFQNVTVARVDEDGSVVTSCVDNPHAAAAFFGIDPQLTEGNPGNKQNNPAKSMP